LFFLIQIGVLVDNHLIRNIFRQRASQGQMKTKEIKTSYFGWLVESLCHCLHN